MKNYLLLLAAVLVFFTVSFIVVEQLQIPLLTDPGTLMQNAGWGAALLGVGLLVADVFIPVPSSLVMILNGALFGVGLGSALSLVGTLGAAWLGFYLGRLGSGWLQRLVPPAQVAQANALLAKWGVIAIVVTRPIPLLAETMTLAAGASPMTWGQVTLAAFAGSLPMAILYAITGATAATFDSALLSFGLVLLIAAAFWAMRHWLQRKLQRSN